MTDGASGAVRIPGRSGRHEAMSNVERGGCEPSACGADRIRGEWGRGTWLLRKAPSARFRMGNAIRGGTLSRVPRYFWSGAWTAPDDRAIRNETHHGPWPLRTSVSSRRSSGGVGHEVVREPSTVLRDPYRFERVDRTIPRCARRSLRRSNHHVPRISTAPVWGHLDSIGTRRSSVTDRGVSCFVSHNPSAPSGAGAGITWDP
jgi:hypothetical protein